MDVTLLIDVLVKVLVLGFALVPVVRPKSSHFAGKAMGARALIYPATTLLIPAIWLIAGRPGPYPLWADVALGLPFAIDAGANVLGLFAIRGFDAIPHSTGWFFLSIAYGLAVAPLVGERWIVFGLVLGFGAVADVLWEAGEFAMMRSGASGLQLTYENTIQDLVLSLAGAAVAAMSWPRSSGPPRGPPRTCSAGRPEADFRIGRSAGRAGRRDTLTRRVSLELNPRRTTRALSTRSRGGPAMRTLVRRFLVLASTLALLLGVVGATAPAALAARSITDTRVRGIDVDATTIPQLERLMDQGRLSSVDLTKFYLRRIRTLNPKLNAVITVSPTALRDARAADEARRNGDDRDTNRRRGDHGDGDHHDHGPLLGIPVIVKDNIDTTGMPTTAGSWALAGSSPRDAFIVKRLRAAGAIVIAKANLSEWANFRSNPSSSGWSGIGGQTNMAYVLDRNPCGSSSGSGVAASADLATVAVGTETDGSVVCPSGANGVVGIKPTLGLLSRSGIVPITADQDTAGPIARNVTDAAVLLGAMAGIDLNDPATADQQGHAFKDYTQFLDKNALKGARIGVWRDGTYDKTISPEIDAMMNATVATLRAQGAIVIDQTRIPIEPAYGPEFTALLCEFKSDVASYLVAHTGHRYPKTLQDLIDFNNAHPDLEGPWNSALFDLAQATGGRADPACTAARTEATSTAKAAIDDLMAANHLDAIIAPTNGVAWVTDPVNGDLGGDFSKFVGSSSPSAIAGYPDITVPAAFVGPLPVGVSFIGGRWDEPTLISLAYAFEQATHVRVPPQFLATTSAAPTTRGDATNREPRVGVPSANGRWVPGLR